MTATPPHLNRCAARFIDRQAANPAEARLFLNMLGLLDGDQIAPDDTKIYMLGEADVSMTRAAMVENNARPKESTAPPALRVLPPLPKSAKPRSDGQKAGPPQDGNLARRKPCGTEAAAKRHRRNGEIRDGEITCATCLKGRAERNQNKRRNRSKCGEPAGYQAHRRNGTDICTPCRTANAKYRRDLRAKIAAERNAA